MVKQDSKGRSIGSDISSLFSDLGLTQASANVNNELLAMQTPAAILETIKRLNLDIDYRTDGFFRKETLYGTSLPVKVTLPELDDNESCNILHPVAPEGKNRTDDFGSSVREFERRTVNRRIERIPSPLHWAGLW